MASIRKIKNEVSYLINEVISDAYVALYFQPESKREAIFGVINTAAELNNNLIDRINHPAEKHNASLVRKHFAQVRKDMFDGIDTLFADLSAACKSAEAKK